MIKNELNSINIWRRSNMNIAYIYNMNISIFLYITSAMKNLKMKIDAACQICSLVLFKKSCYLLKNVFVVATIIFLRSRL